MSLPPSSDTDVDARQEGEIQVVGMTDKQTSKVLNAISSATAREILTEVYNQPATPSEIADRTGGSVQNVSYHLNKLEDAGAIEVADTRYSEKGQEMRVYAPADEPIVVFVGTEERQSGLLSRLKRLVSAVGVVIAISFVIGIVVDDSMLFGIQMNASASQVTGFPLAIGFLIGGLFSLLLVGLWIGWSWYVDRENAQNSI